MDFLSAPGYVTLSWTYRARLTCNLQGFMASAKINYPNHLSWSAKVGTTPHAPATCEWLGATGSRLFKLGRASQGNVVKIIHQRVWEYLSEMGHRLWVHGFADTGLNGIVISRHLFFQMLSMCIHCCQLRTVLLALVVMSRNAIWVLEQPGNSLLAKHHRFEWMANHVAYVSWLGFMIEVAIVYQHVLYPWPTLGDQGMFCAILDATSWWSKSKSNSCLQLHAGNTFIGFGRVDQWPGRRKNVVLKPVWFDPLKNIMKNMVSTQWSSAIIIPVEMCI